MKLPLLIIEGSENIYSLRNFHPNSIRGMLASIAIDFQIPILFTRNIKDTAALLTIIVQRLEKPIKNISHGFFSAFSGKSNDSITIATHISALFK